MFFSSIVNVHNKTTLCLNPFPNNPWFLPVVSGDLNPHLFSACAFSLVKSKILALIKTWVFVILEKNFGFVEIEAFVAVKLYVLNNGIYL